MPFNFNSLHKTVKILFVVPTPLEGEELYTQLVFCSDKFGRSIYSSYRFVRGIIKKCPSSVEYFIQKIVAEFRFLQGVIEVLTFQKIE